MKNSSNKTLIVLAILSVLLIASFSIVYADSIGAVVASIIERVTIALDRIGQGKVDTSENEMDSLSNETKASIESIVTNAQNDLSKELDEYKNAQIIKKNEEVESLLQDVEASVNNKKAEKLSEYQQKIDEVIDREYEKLINDLKLN